MTHSQGAIPTMKKFATILLALSFLSVSAVADDHKKKDDHKKEDKKKPH
jgi:hypothetical protein